jgi:alanine racemase
MPRPIHARIHVSALRNNLAVVRAHAPSARVWSVIKANAYGHGIRNVYEGLRGTDGFALLDLDEALLLRSLGWQGPVLLLEGFFSTRDLDLVSRHHLASVVHNEEQLRLLEAHRGRRAIEVLLKINTGMNRLGFAPSQLQDVWTRLSALPFVSGITLMSHFANADESDGVAHQLSTFEKARAGIPGPASLANSAAILWHPATHHDWVRPGIILYGASPTGRQADIAASGLQATMSLCSELIAVQDVARGDTVGYGSTYTASRKTRIGIVACGYADGYPRHARGSGRERTPVLVNGQRCRLAGRVSMDMLAVELPAHCDAGPGSPVTLWGPGLPIDEVAASAGTIGYELMCALAPRIPVQAD